MRTMQVGNRSLQPDYNGASEWGQLNIRTNCQKRSHYIKTILSSWDHACNIQVCNRWSDWPVSILHNCKLRCEVWSSTTSPNLILMQDRDQSWGVLRLASHTPRVVNGKADVKSAANCNVYGKTELARNMHAWHIYHYQATPKALRAKQKSRDRNQRIRCIARWGQTAHEDLWSWHRKGAI